MLDQITLLAVGASGALGISAVAQVCIGRARMRFAQVTKNRVETAITLQDAADAAELKFLAELEQNFVAHLKPSTGLTLSAWMTAISLSGLTERNAIIDWLKQRHGFAFADASRLQILFHRGGRLCYGEHAPTRVRTDSRREPDLHLPAQSKPATAIAAFNHDQLTHAPRIAPVKAAQMLIQFMQARGATGYFTVPEIDAWWSLLVAEQKLDDLHPTVVRSELSAIPNTWMGLRRLNGPEFRTVKARTGRDRAILYRIPAFQSAAGNMTDAPRSARAAPGGRSGKRPANPQKRVLPGSFEPETVREAA